MEKAEIKSNFFQEWTSEMAYILGFIAADGSVSKRKNRKNSYTFNITNKDRTHLTRIKNIFCPKQRLGLKRSGYTGRKDYCYFQLCNREICTDLINLGIVPRKTYSFKLPQIPDDYFADFVLGFFDGDGTVYIYSVNNTLQIKVGFVSCSVDFIQGLNNRLCKHLGILPKNIHRTEPKDERKLPMYSICLYVDDCEKLANFMYRGRPSLFLSRKRNVFERWKTIKRRGYNKKQYPSKIGWQLNKISI